jgi:hypothetical protein
MRSLIHAKSAIRSRLGIALVASATLSVVGCGGSSNPSASATPTAQSATPSAVAATSPLVPSTAAFDACLVGTWKVVAQSQNSPANDESIAYSGGQGEVYAIDAQGGVTIDTTAAQKIVFVSAGQTFTATVAGTGRGTLSTLTTGPTKYFKFTPSSDDSRTTHSVGPDGVELGPARPDTAFSAVYTCAPGRFTFYKSSVDYMVDGPIVTLTSGSGSAPSTANASPS